MESRINKVWNILNTSSLLTLIMVVCFGATSVYAQNTQSASFIFSTLPTQIEQGKQLTVDVKINSSQQSINAVSGSLSYSSDLMRVKSISKEQSIINLWTEEPRVSDNRILFEGVILNPGFRGSNGLLFRITLEAIHTGNVVLSFSDGLVLANDGRGTNVPVTFSSSTLESISAPGVLENKPIENRPILESVVAPIITKYLNFVESNEMFFLKNKDKSISSTKIIFLEIIIFSILSHFWRKMSLIKRKKLLEKIRANSSV